MILCKHILEQRKVRDAIRLLVEDFDHKGEILGVVQIGACNGEIENDPLQETIKGRDHVEVHLVEAVKWLYDDLVEVMRPYSDKIHCHNLAICARDETRKLFYVSKEKALEHPEWHDWMRFQLGSLTDKYLKAGMPRLELDTIDVQCMSPKSFLKHAKLKAKNLDLLIVDAEGLDGEIITAFLKLSRPQVLVYEHKIITEKENTVLISLLDNCGYIHRKIGDDILACRAGYGRNLLAQIPPFESIFSKWLSREKKGGS